MPTITSYGLEQEARVVPSLIAEYTERLQKRGVTDERFTQLLTKVTTMTTARAAALGAVKGKKKLTISEAAARKEVVSYMGVIRRAVRLVFPEGSPEREEFHIGETGSSSTKIVLGYADDTVVAWIKYKNQLVEKGALEDDYTNLVGAIALLRSTDTTQEKAKSKDAPDATAAFVAARNAVKEDLDDIENRVEMEFPKEPEVLARFREVKKLRYSPAPRGTEEPAPAPAQPASTPA